MRLTSRGSNAASGFCRVASFSACGELPAAAAERLEDGAVPPWLLRELFAVEYGTGGFGYNGGWSDPTITHRYEQLLNSDSQVKDQQRQIWFIPLADERGVCR